MITPIQWTGSELLLLDQRRLPAEESYVRCKSAHDVAEAIRTMVVRGAPAIGICAAFGIAVDALAGRDVRAAAEELRKTRPTAVNLQWAINRMLTRAETASAQQLVAEAVTIFDEDVEANRRIGRYGAKLLRPNATVLTHCNAGALATGGYGTALGVVRAAHESGARIAVFADETRPFLQGARLTAWELQRDGIDVTLITDNMAGHFFQQRRFDAVLVGADRIAANGDTANKIGTYTLAVLADAHNVPFYVAAPLSTIDLHSPDGSEIPIEERDPDEVLSIAGVAIAPEGVTARHPAFDVTPARLISAIITDRGVLHPPYEESIAILFHEPTAVRTS